MRLNGKQKASSNSPGHRKTIAFISTALGNSTLHLNGTVLGDDLGNVIPPGLVQAKIEVLRGYTLTIFSSPTGVTFTVDGVSRTTPWSETYIEGSSVSLVMPEAHDGYFWSHWLEDGDTNRIKIVTMNTDILLTAAQTCRWQSNSNKHINEQA